MDLMRIPLATILFIGPALLLVSPYSPLNGMDSVASTIIAMACIVCLVYSIMLYSNINIVR